LPTLFETVPRQSGLLPVSSFFGRKQGTDT
jgi:hypothetical protein